MIVPYLQSQTKGDETGQVTYSRSFYFQNNKIKTHKKYWCGLNMEYPPAKGHVLKSWSGLMHHFEDCGSFKEGLAGSLQGGGAFEGYTHPWLPFIQLFDCALRSLPHILTTTNSWTELRLPSLPQHELSPLANTSQRTPLPLLLFMQLFYLSNISRHTGWPLTPHPPASSLPFELIEILGHTQKVCVVTPMYPSSSFNKRQSGP